MKKIRQIIVIIIVFLSLAGCSKTIYTINGKKVNNNEINLTGHNPILGLFKKSKIVEFDGWQIKIDLNDEIVGIPFYNNYYRNSKYAFEANESRYTGNVFQALATTKNTLVAILVYYDADPDSFEPFIDNTDFSRDNEQVFYKTIPVPGADSESFQVFKEGNLETVGVDNKSVFIKTGEIKNSHGPTFVQLNEYYSKDRNLIYYHLADQSFAIGGSDGSTAQLINNSLYYMKDRNSVYFLGTVIPGARRASFKIIDEINEYFGKDDTSVFFKGRRVEGADPNGFIDLGFHYGKDSRAVYYEEKEITGSDPSSFVAKSLRNSSDMNNQYIYGEIDNDG